MKNVSESHPGCWDATRSSEHIRYILQDEVRRDRSLALRRQKIMHVLSTTLFMQAGIKDTTAFDRLYAYSICFLLFFFVIEISKRQREGFGIQLRSQRALTSSRTITATTNLHRSDMEVKGLLVFTSAFSFFLFFFFSCQVSEMKRSSGGLRRSRARVGMES